jgi:hypothetical protein
VSTIALTGFGWIQIAGVAAVLTHGTVVAAQPVAYLATAGAVDPLSATIASTVTQPVIGVVIRVSAAAAWSVVLLNGFP